jgi:hypothetical protein
MNGCQKDIEDRRALLQEQIHSFGLSLGPVPNLFAGHLPSGSLKLVVENHAGDQQRSQGNRQC